MIDAVIFSFGLVLLIFKPSKLRAETIGRKVIIARLRYKLLGWSTENTMFLFYFSVTGSS